MNDKSHLLRFGYAPGNYWFVCSDCGDKQAIGDKRAIRCETCAESLHAQITSVEAVADKNRAMTTLPEEAVKAAKDVLYYANPNDVERALTAAFPHLVAVKRIGYVSAVELHTLQQIETCVDLFTVAQGGPMKFVQVYAAADQLFGNSEQLNLATDMGNPITLTYTNYRGETSERTITPIRPWFGSTEWHPEPQWLLTAFDHEKQANRDFAIKDFGWPQPKVEKGDTFKGTVDGDTELQAAARHAGWALIELVDEIDWLKREQVSDIITRLGIALNEPSADACPCTTIQQDETCPVGYPSLLCEICDGKGVLQPSAARELALEEALQKEKSLSDRLASALEYIDDYCLSYPDLGTISAVAQPALKAHSDARALSSQPVADHADAGKVEGDGWLPMTHPSLPKKGRFLAVATGEIERISWNDPAAVVTVKAFDGPFVCYVHEDGAGFTDEFGEVYRADGVVIDAEDLTAADNVLRLTRWRPLPSAPASEGA